MRSLHRAHGCSEGGTGIMKTAVYVVAGMSFVISSTGLSGTAPPAQKARKIAATTAPMEPAAKAVVPVAPAPTVDPVWGPLTTLPGRVWLMTTTRPVLFMRFEWARVGISMVFTGKDLAGNHIEGQYFLDPITNTVRVSTVYQGKAALTDLTIAPAQVTEIGKGPKGPQRVISQLHSDGAFTVTSQRPKGKEWETVSVATFAPASDELIASLDWPADAPARPSFLKSLGEAIKGGALEGLREGTREGLRDAAQDRIRRATGTKPTCRDASGTAVPCS